MKDPVPLALRVAKILEGLGIDYWLGGSLASSVHGEPRSTQDVDFVVSVSMSQGEDLIRGLDQDFLVDSEFLREAIRARDSFQVIEKQGHNRVDVFVMKGHPFQVEQLRRRERVVLDAKSGAEAWVTTAEDITLQKLSWYREGGGVSDQQWRDVLGVLKANPHLDRAYLERWADELGVMELLERALDEAGLERGG